MSMGPSHDQEVIDELFENVIEAAAILEKNDEDIQKIKTAKSKLFQPKIAPDGRLQEWAEPFEETESGIGISRICGECVRATASPKSAPRTDGSLPQVARNTACQWKRPHWMECGLGRQFLGTAEQWRGSPQGGEFYFEN